MRYRCLLALANALLLTVSLTAESAPKFKIDETTIAETEEAIRSGKVTCRELVETYLARIRTYDQASHLNAIVTLNPDALADADQLDQEFARTHKLRPLHGIVVIVKDNYDTKGLQTTGGSLALKWFNPTDDATMVRRLRDAGAIVLAKSNMAEWAFSPVVTESSIAGVTRNPYALDRVPAGSSGGTAAAVAANFGEVGLGTDTGDSIRGPASHNDLVGIRPTIGLTSRDGIIPLSSTNDVGGPLARSVADAAAILAVVQGYDPADPITKLSDGKAEAGYTNFLDKNGLKGARIGVVRSYIDTPTTDPKVKAITEKAIAELKAQGAVIVDSFPLPDFERSAQKSTCGGFEFDLNQYFARHGQTAPYHSLQEIIDSGLYLGSVEERLKKASQKDPGSVVACPDTYHDARKIKFRDDILRVMDAEKLDAIIYPTWSNVPRKVGDIKSPGGDNSQVISPMTGFPAISVPIGFADETLPVGLTFVGRSFSEGLLFKLAYAYEQATQHRHPPAFFPPL
ncbi:amidase [Granulicella arctica]|uniref:amidase n=1 Tax=Granulicella arctica TaxID=940613 RepID=UPI0021DFFF45|nr:amidase family protein [Granulicella arctica]